MGLLFLAHLGFSVFFRQVIFAHKGDIFGHWDAEWSHTWTDLKEKPKRSPKGVEFLLKVIWNFSGDTCIMEMRNKILPNKVIIGIINPGFISLAMKVLLQYIS